MSDLLQEFATITEQMFVPRPQSVEEICERCRSTNYQAFASDDVPAAKADGWTFACDLGNNRALMYRGEP